MAPMILEFDITPVSASRPIVRRGGGVGYGKRYKAFKQTMAILIAAQPNLTLMEKPVEMSFYFYMPIPKSWSRKKKALMRGQFHTQKPDLDNLIKAMKDTLTGHAFTDDCYVASYRRARKEWADKGLIVVELESLT